jgi:4-hydroxymandelate oxidase
MSDGLEKVSLAGLERMAREVLSEDAWAYYSTGARDEYSQRAAQPAWDVWSLVPRVLQDATANNVATTILGQPVLSPIMVAPMAAQRLAHPEAELATARAAASAGSIFVLSMSANEPIEVVSAIDNSHTWLQLYVPEDARALDGLVERAVASGASALVVTVDSILEQSTHRRPHGGLSHAFPDMPMHPGSPMKHSLAWNFIHSFIERSDLPVVLKGILSPIDARLAVDAGCKAIVVSNHGGRQLDGAISTAQVLPDIVDAVDGQAEVYVDGGIRRGSHILKALALGARAVLVGRPFLWGLSIAGERGVSKTLQILNDELLADAQQCGVASLAEVPRDLVRRNWLSPNVPPADYIRGQ